MTRATYSLLSEEMYRVQGARCFRCGEPALFPEMDLDHVVPRSRIRKGVSSKNRGNLALSHRRCNHAHGNALATPEQLRRFVGWYGSEPWFDESEYVAVAPASAISEVAVSSTGAIPWPKAPPKKQSALRRRRKRRARPHDRASRHVAADMGSVADDNKDER